MTATRPSYLTTSPAVSRTAALVELCSPVTPLYICERVSGYWSKTSPPLSVTSAYERAATACALSASGCQLEGISPGTTPCT